MGYIHVLQLKYHSTTVHIKMISNSASSSGRDLGLVGYYFTRSVKTPLVFTKLVPGY